MDRDVLLMLYGAVIGVASSILTSLVTFMIQLWFERREYERRQDEEHKKQIRQIHLPTSKEIKEINLQREDAHQPEMPHRMNEVGSLILALISLTACGLLAFQLNSPTLSFLFPAVLGFLMTNRLIRLLRR